MSTTRRRVSTTTLSNKKVQPSSFFREAEIDMSGKYLTIASENEKSTKRMPTWGFEPQSSAFSHE